MMYGGDRRVGFVLDRFETLQAAYQDRNVQVAKNRAYVLGDQWDAVKLGNLPEGVLPVTLNYIYPIVLKNVTFQVGRPPEISVPIAEDSPGSRQYASWLEKVHYAIWDVNGMYRRFHDMAWNCSVAGGQPIITDWDPIRRMPRFSTPLPERFYPVPSQMDDGTTCEGFVVEQFYTPEYLSARYGGQPYEWQTDHEDGGVEYVTVLRYSDGQNHYWVNKSTETMLDQRLGYGFVNAAYLPNIPVAGGLDGLADVTGLRQIQDRINHLLTMQGSVLELYSDPPVVVEGTNVDLATLSWGPGMKIPVEIGGSVKFLTWEGTPPDFREHLIQLITSMQDMSGMPDVTFGRYEASIQSGIALNTQFQPTRLLMAIKQSGWTAGLGEAHKQALWLMREHLGDKPVELFGHSPKNNDTAPVPFSIQARGEDFNGYSRFDLVWPGMLPKDDATEAQTLLNRLQSNAISLETYLEQMGHESPGDEISRIKAELSDPVLHPENVPDPAAGGGMAGAQMMPGMGGAALGGMGGGMGLDPATMFGAGGAMPTGMGSDSSSVSDEAMYAARRTG